MKLRLEMVLLLNLLSKGRIIYIPKSLSRLRLHTKNISKSPKIILNALQDLMHLLFHTKKFCFFTRNRYIPTCYQKYL